jgi:hypothetical protein
MAPLGYVRLQRVAAATAAGCGAAATAGRSSRTTMEKILFYSEMLVTC